MSKLNWVLPTLVVTAMISSLSTGWTQTTKAQAVLSGTGEDFSGTLAQNNQPSGGSQPPMPRRTGGSRGINPWMAIFQALPKDNTPPPQPRTGAPRFPVCAIAPKSIGNYTEIWSEKPLFVWQGSFKRIEVRSAGSTQVLWRENVKDNATQLANTDMYKITYAGEALKPGKTYEWRLFFHSSKDTPLDKIETFQVMTTEKRDRIQQEFQDIEQELQDEQASPEEMARRRAQYFAQQQLWSDVLQETYSVENPSAALNEIRQGISKQMCSKPTGETSIQPR